MTRGERGERAVGVGVVLDEDVVPDLDAAGVRAVDKRGAGFLLIDARLARAGAQIDVDFGARTAGAGVAHHPEIVLLVAIDDVNGGIEAGGTELPGPDLPGFLVPLGRVAPGGVRLVDGGVEAFGREFPDVDNEFPGPGDGFLFEVVAERPVPEHFEERVVVGVEADVIEVVVFSAGADALLRVGGAAGGVRAFDLAEEDRDELVHARIGEEEVRRVRQEAGRRHDGVLLRSEEVEKAGPDLGGGHAKPSRKAGAGPGASYSWGTGHGARGTVSLVIRHSSFGGAERLGRGINRRPLNADDGRPRLPPTAGYRPMTTALRSLNTVHRTPNPEP